MSKKSPRCVLRILTPERKLQRANISRTLLTNFHANLKNFHGRLVTQYETWTNHFESESKIQNKQWKYSGFLSPSKFKLTVSYNGSLSFFFIYSESVIMIHLLEMDNTMQQNFDNLKKQSSRNEEISWEKTRLINQHEWVRISFDVPFIRHWAKQKA